MIENITKFRILNGALQYLTFNGIWKHLLTIDELTSIRNASSPSGSNVLATTNDVTAVSDTLNSTIQSIVDLDTVSAIASTDIDWSGSKYLSKTLAENTELFDTNLPVNPITKEIYLHVTPATYDLTLPTYWRVISGTFDNTVDNLIKAVCIDGDAVKKVDTITLTGAAPEKQVDTVTLTGTSGTAEITLAGGLTKTVTFAAGGTQDLTQTASDFVTSFAADYLAEEIVLTSSGADLIFTSTTYGLAFVSPAIANLTGDLGGSVANTQANVVVGEAEISAAGGLTKTVTFAADGTTDLAQTAEDFVTSFASDYLAQKIVITNSGADIIFTSQYAGYDFTSPVITNTVGDLDGTVDNTTANTSPIVWAWIYKEA